MVASASKYAIVSLTVGQVLVGRNSVKAIKQEFQRLVGENAADLVVIDFQGESLVRFIGGKVLKGQNYRKFSQRGVQDPKPKAPVCKVPTVQNVCQDVIERIDAKNLVAYSGNLLGVGGIGETWKEDGEEITASFRSDIAAHLEKSESAQAVINKTVCHVCGKGAVLAAWIGLYNNFTVEQLSTCSYDLDYSSVWPKELIELFGRKLLDEIEVAFERTDFGWTSKEIGYDRRRELIARYVDITNKDERLRAIMCDVRDGKF